MGKHQRFEFLVVGPLALLSTFVLSVLVGACSNPVHESPASEEPPESPQSQIVTISFDTSIPGILDGRYAGGGVALDPTEGYLDANAWRIVGMSDGDHEFGEERISGDFARGVTTGGVSTGGLYAIAIAEENNALGVQATASDFAPGEIHLRIPTKIAAAARVALEYTLYSLNDQDRAMHHSTHWSLDGESWSAIDGAEWTGVAEEVASPEWIATTIAGVIDLTGLDVAPEEWIYLCFKAEDSGGSGGRDEFALDDIVVRIESTTEPL